MNGQTDPSPQSMFCGILEVEGELSPGQVEVTGCSLDRDTVQEGQDFTIDVTVQNGSSSDANVTVTATVGGENAGSASDTIPPNSSKILSITSTQDLTEQLGPGDHPVDVNISDIAAATPRPQKHTTGLDDGDKLMIVMGTGAIVASWGLRQVL